MTLEKTQNPIGLQEPRSATSPLSLEFDATEFAHFLSEADWSDEQKAEYITLIWSIVCEFVALGFNVHPVQQARVSCGEVPDFCGKSASLRPGMVNSSHGDLIEEFMRLNRPKAGSRAGGVIDE
ncbi:hypothetical protein T8K17_25210 [Thalassobaculum sp. OXR-137]|uniref:hypothetical protein n=1 Tax=Thalassobaculum sp. OXR-137 TaxID=3100173 RepID=UPI002AC9A88C|nr:hypothetical protein [Thalassobaculum sp. OXR-137]WPZ34510.1 hypothetical protein T8K17_25210 [Thalassobaculum sp. OXR-137]